jgi:tight adherence protein B
VTRTAQARARLAAARTDGGAAVQGGWSGTRWGVPPSALVLGCVVLALVALVAGPRLAAALTAAGLLRPVALRLRRSAGRRRLRAAQLPPALERLATSLRSGASLPAAMAEAAAATEPPLGAELAAVAEATRRGRPIVAGLDDWSWRHDDAGTRLAATAMALATVVGSAPARAVDGVAATLRERLDLDAERRALGAQARASALVLAIAPLAFAAVLIAGDTSAARFLLTTPGGWTCLAAGVSLDAAGAWWMARLTRGAAP